MAALKILPWALSATLMLCSGAALAQSNQSNWLGVDGTPWRTGDGSQCWRDSSWTPATASPNCDGALSPVATVLPIVVPYSTPEVPPEPITERVSYSADTFFNFDKSTLRLEAKEVLDEMVRRLQYIDLEVIVTTGHTDSTGPAAYNMNLSLRRAEAVKAYLVSHGVPDDRIYIEGKGETEPVATNSTRAGRTQNRRVTIEIVGTVTRTR